MVLNHNDKRKRKEGDLVDLVDPLSGSPKRPKVHAQRKFAQGAATIFNSPVTPIKEKEKMKSPVFTELITHRRPNTEDFLTFLCFRGTSILPPRLNFFNVGTKKEKHENKTNNNSSNNSIKNTSLPCNRANVTADTSKNNAIQKTTTKVKSNIPIKNAVSTVIRKNIKFKSTSSTVQALKKKYQEQRLAKHRIKNKLVSSNMIKTRSRSEQPVIKSINKLAPRKFPPKVEVKRRGLRSSGLLDRDKILRGIPPKAKFRATLKQKHDKKSNNKKKIVKQKKRCIKEKVLEPVQSASPSEEEEDNDEEEEEDSCASKSLAATKRIDKTVEKKIFTRSKTEMRRITRSHREETSSVYGNQPQRPTRKTKEAAAVYMEILGRKLVSPDLENDDNISLDSFPELPNARRTAQTENEIKTKVTRLTTRSVTRDIKNRLATVSSAKRFTKSGNKDIKSTILKNKRQLRLKRYCEIESEDESASSSEESSKTRPITRRSAMKSGMSTNRNLRSSSRKIINSETAKKEDSTSAKSKADTKAGKEKIITMKRKRGSEKTTEKVESVKQKKLENKEENVGSEEETLGQLLTKIKEKKELKKMEKDTNDETKTIKKVQQVEDVDNAAKILKDDKVTELKMSDDEDAFKGFTKKAITKVLNSCNSRANKNISMSIEMANQTTVEKINSCAQNNLPSNTISNEAILKPDKDSNQDTPNQTDIQKQESKGEKYSLNDPKNCITNIMNVPPKSSLNNWKERLNLSVERIEKWLNDSSLAKEEKIELENDKDFKYKTSLDEKKPLPPRSHLSISTKIQHLVRPVNVTLSKLAEKNSRNIKLNRAIVHDSKSLTGKQTTMIIKNTKDIPEKEDSIECSILCTEIDEGKQVEETLDLKSEKITADEVIDLVKVQQDKKSISQPRKLFQQKIKERKVTTPNANAFSAENESSVYAFESDNETMPVSTPFRRKLRDGSKHSTLEVTSPMQTSTEEKHNLATEKNEATAVVNKLSKSTSSEATTSTNDSKLLNQIKSTLPLSNKLNTHNFELPKSFANLANMQVLPLDKLSTSWCDVNCSSSIAVQVNLDDQVEESHELSENEEKEENKEEDKCQKSIEISTQTESNNDNDDDNNGHLFYIPFQAVTRNGSNLVQGQQFIQGVAVKFGTEGPNQRVMLKAKLVTKPSLTVARCPPIGTVQPTTRIPVTSTAEVVVPSTSTTTLSPVPSTSNSQCLPASNSDKSSISTTVETVMTATVTSSEKNVKSPKAVREKRVIPDSAKQMKRCQSKSKLKGTEVYSPSNKTSFPNIKDSLEEARLVEAPTFHPSEKDFQDPLEYIDKIRPIAEKFGICRVVPPQNFKPECKVSDDMRFTAYNQYVHRMLHRWGPNVKEMMAIKKYLATQSITLTHPPWIGGMEVDLPHLYQTVQSLGGLKEVIEKKKWQKVADGMKIPRSAQDRVTKLDDIYCKYLLPYDTLSPEEREKLFEEVESEWKKKESRALLRQDAQSNDNNEDEEDEDSSDEIEECIVKGRNMPLNAFYRIARNTQRMWFGENQRSGNETEGASAEEVEAAFWRHVSDRKRHVCVHNASIDSSGRGFGFSVAKNSPFARHPWNLKVLTNNAGSVLRALGPLMGVTVPTLHVGMLFSACCWYRDPHGLPWIEYLHTGAKKIWYGIPDEHSNTFREALMKMVPRYCKNKTIWLPSDTAMVPPDLLVGNGVPLCHTVQEPGQFIIVFPKAFTSSICTGYVVSESVYFAQPSWLETAEQVFKDIKDSCEPSIFSFERLLISIINDTKSQLPVLQQILPSVKMIWEKEMHYREELEQLGLTNTEKLPLPESGKRGKGKRVKEDDGDYECETCRANLFLSLVSNNQEDSVYCLPHALQLLQSKKLNVKNCMLMYTYSNNELHELVRKLQERIEAKSKKTNQIKQIK